MAALRAGVITFNCEECLPVPNDPEAALQQKEQIREALGCDKPTQVPVWTDGEYEFYNCPKNFIHDGAYLFLQEYEAYKGGWATPPAYWGFSNRFIEAVMFYERYFAEFRAQVKQRINPNEFGNNLEAFNKD